MPRPVGNFTKSQVTLDQDSPDLGSVCIGFPVGRHGGAVTELRPTHVRSEKSVLRGVASAIRTNERDPSISPTELLKCS